MAKSLKNSRFFAGRTRSVVRHYKQAIGGLGVAVVLAVFALEALCFCADLLAFGLLFGQVMGDAKGMVAAGSISLLFPLVSYFGFRGLSSRFAEKERRERFTYLLLGVMGVFLVAVLAIRFPLEAAAVSDEGVSWAMTAAVYCLPPISSVIGALAASLTLHNPQVESRLRRCKAEARIANIKAEIATLEHSDPSRLREHVNDVYRSAFCEVDGLLNAALASCVAALVETHGMGVHDHIGKMKEVFATGLGLEDSRPAAFAPSSRQQLEEGREGEALGKAALLDKAGMVAVGTD
ncbi:MAG TPA: hypothetical protein IAA69_01010 [Candidatus Aveggerthella stercoripullorum]|uniref:Uncharacterized protein n=1 Tax=Candidatus Aveggerthella stercoripullorum TaxID=2840688 RepID=A0A9D0ZYI7_9ACTN|nr:hypothetical protein [Candidatus Aveggerthella stercoripullorum]